MGYRGMRSALVTSAAVYAMAVAGPAWAQEKSFNVPAQSAVTGIPELARQADVQILVSESAVRGKTTKAVHGRMSVDQALRRLLSGTGLHVSTSDGRTFTLAMKGAESASASSAPPSAGDALAASGRRKAASELGEGAGATEDQGREILVTGSRIRGAPIASQTITITQKQMRDAGQNTLVDALRDIPQNFGGGQNPGIGQNVPEGNGVAYGGVASINLRGLGSDATLTLLNGHRLSYSIADQAIDISTIPALAVDRIEIVADGASALYGSDAVAGVANIILKRDYQGLSTSARFGASTDGGNQQQQYDILAGTTWASGGFFFAYEFERDTPIRAHDRDYAAIRSPGLYLYPSLRHHDVIASAHQKLSDNLRFDVDVLYNKRWTYSQYALDGRGDPLAYGARIQDSSETFVVAPSLTATIFRNWEVSALGMFGIDRTHLNYSYLLAGTPFYQQISCFCNAASSAEVNANGPLFRLVGGDAKLAVGGGYRSNTFRDVSAVGGGGDIRRTQNNYYGFGELSLPFISPGQEFKFAYRLNLSGALRYEDYPGVGHILTPKLGLIYAPTADFDLRGSWGKSFKAPTLYDRFSTQYATLYSAASRGGAGYPASATALVVSGGNENLKPERATTWSATFAAHPRGLEGATFEISYFNIHYRDRIVTPIAFPGQSLSNAAYADLVNLNPTDADKANAIAGADIFQSAIVTPYDSGNVVAIIDNVMLNVAQQKIDGVDASVRYRIALAGAHSLSFSANGSYVRSTRMLSALQAATNLAGTIFNPPHFRGRVGAVWDAGSLTLGSWLNYTGGVTDTRTSTYAAIGSMTTVDLTMRYVIERGGGLLRGTEFSLSMRNIADTRPSLIRSTQPYETPYDSTNYSPFGRVVSFQVVKKW